jgi:hypothetical protein
VASPSLLFLDPSYNRISLSIPKRSPVAPGRPRPPPSFTPSGDLAEGSPAGLRRLTAAAAEADGGQNQRIIEERAGNRWEERHLNQ